MNNIILNNTTLYPLTHPQKRIWYIEKIYNETSVNNIGGYARIKGQVDFQLLEEAINILVKNNEGLRLRFIEQSENVNQYVSNYERIKVDFLDFTVFKDPEIHFENWISEEAKKPFELMNSVLFKFVFFKISNNDSGYLAKFHHIISDGWSINIMTKQVFNTYNNLLKGIEVDNSSSNSYLEYVEKEKKYLSSDKFLKNKKFWNEKLDILPETLLNNNSTGMEGKRGIYTIDKALSADIKEFALSNKISLNAFFVTMYLIFLHKTTQTKDIVIGTPVLNRSGKNEKNIFGMFTSTMPFRYKVDSNETVRDTMTDVYSKLKECYYNQKYPYDLLVQDLELKKKGYDGLFSTCVNYYNTDLVTNFDGIPVENFEIYSGKQFYALQIIIKDWLQSGCITLAFDYKVKDYTPEEIEKMYEYLCNIIGQSVNDTDIKLCELSLLNENERKMLIYDFNNSVTNYPKHKTVHMMFEEQVEIAPNKIAINFKNDSLTYRKLNNKANQLARRLSDKGVTKDTIVVLMTKHSIETVIGMLSILKAGGAYLPIDPSYPADRINYMLKDSNAVIMLVNFEMHDNIYFSGDILNLNDSKLYSGDDSNYKGISNPNDLAYVIYTSGSTGKPKGTMIEQQGLVNYIYWAKQMYVRDDNEVFALYSSLAFDLTVTSIFVPLISGNKIMVYSDDDDEYVLYRIMKERKATVVKLTPSHLSLLKDLDNSSSSVKRFIIGGEDLKVNLAKSIYESFGGNIELYNEYGPTETVVGCMIHKYDYEKDTDISVPIGIPAHNVQIYILDKYLEPVPVGVAGEIYISGDGIARGYINSKKLTNERFICNPFINGNRMYKTGDLAKHLEDGKITYLGRVDYQVKIRGFRIELGEIEKHLINYEYISQAIVIERENVNKEKYLCAYIVALKSFDVSMIRTYLSTSLPDYMIPAYFVVLNELPLTQNGKVNRELLPEPTMKSEIRESEYIYPRNGMEEKLISILKEVLNVENVYIEDNFYHIGGDSIKAIQISSKLNTLGLKLRVKDILSYPILGEMFNHIEFSNDTNIDKQEPIDGYVGKTPITSWFFLQGFKNLNHWNQSVLLDLKQDISVKEFKEIFSVLIKHHDSLRLNYDVQTEALFYNNNLTEKPLEIKEYDLTLLPHKEQKDAVISLGEELKASINIETDLMVKACIFNMGTHGKRLLITAHHLVIDGVAWRILLKDMVYILEALRSNKPLNLPGKTCSFQRWAKELEVYSKNDALKELEFWDSMVSGSFEFYSSFNNGKDIIEQKCTISKQLSEELTEFLITSANIAYNTEPKDLMIIALVLSLSGFTNKNEITIEIEGHGREDIFEDINVSETIGWFTSLYPVSFMLEEKSLDGRIKVVKERLKQIPNKGIGFGVLKYLAERINDNNRRYIRFNYLGDISNTFRNEYFDLSNEESGSDISKSAKMTSLVDIIAIIKDKKINISMTFSEAEFEKIEVGKFLDLYINELNELANYCVNKDSIEFTPSDFDTLNLSQDEIEGIFSF